METIRPLRKSILLSGDKPTGYDEYLPESITQSEYSSLMIFSHGFKGFASWGFIPYVCTEFAKAGIPSIAVNYSYNGILDEVNPLYDAEVFAANTVSLMLEELNGLVNHILSGGDRDLKLSEKAEITLAGHSLGAALSLITAAERKDIDNLVLWGSVGTLDRNTTRQKQNWKEKGRIEFMASRGGQELYQNYSYLEDKENNMDRLDLLQRASEYAGDLLVLHGKADVTTRPKEGEALYNSAKQREGNHRTEIEILDKTGHTFNTFHPMQSPPPTQVTQSTQIMLDFVLNSKPNK
ncbi:MAG: hypothetical protein Kapaf2KO_06510 [Candidatus Kapaibacteriales bacterium]